MIKKCGKYKIMLPHLVSKKKSKKKSKKNKWLLGIFFNMY